MTKKNLLRPSALVLVSILMSAGLAGCDQKKDTAPAAPAANALALPLTTGPAAAIVSAPAAAALPSAPPVRVERVAKQSENYAYVDRAYEMSSAIGQAPPDYGFDYDGVHPWVWRSANREVRLIEPVDGGYRYYYYQAGSSEPYLVRDPQYSYGFSDGQLVTVYDNEGRLLPSEYIDQRANDAGRYLARARVLYEASLQSERHSVNAANWSDQRAELDAARTRWEADQSQQDAWRAYHAEHEAEQQAYWRLERDQREQSSRSFNNWSSRDYNGPPPPPVSYAGRDARGQQTGSDSNSGSGGDRTGNARDRAQSAQTTLGTDHQGDAARQTQQQQTAIDQARAQQAQTDAARQVQEKAQQQAQIQARQQQAQAVAARQAQAKADAARQSKAKAAADAAQAQQQQAQIQARQQQAQADAAHQAQAKADAARQSKAKAAADAAQAQQQQALIQARQQQAQADAAHQAQAKAAPALQAGPQLQKPSGASQSSPAPAQLTQAQKDARRVAAKKALDDAHRGNGASGKPPAQQ
ncbi:MAG: hypothetical protein RB191_24145 [Terriglobia bacterium]|nr:hypothetical protein [Terriglobia bacterium]